jgi:hypothetical protein
MPSPRANNLFQVPEVIDPPTSLCLTMQIPNDETHVANVLGALAALNAARAYMNKPGVKALDIANVWRRYNQTIKITDSCDMPVPQDVRLELPNMSDLVQVICDSNGDCILQYRCDVCSPWITVANLGDLVANPPGTGNQPKPGGGSATYCKTLQANGQIIIPTPVNTGDIIQITSVTGNGNDGSESTWRCADGNVFYVECTGTDTITAGTDPVPTAPHMSLIVLFPGVAYPLYPGGSLTVPSGIVNQQPIIQVNDFPINNDSGSYDVCIKVTNNQTATWTHHFDFTLNDGGWVLDPAVGPCPGQYVFGTGWKSLDNNCGANPGNGYLTFLKYFSRTITNIRVKYSVAGAGWSGDLDDGSIALGILDTTAGSHDLSFAGTHVITNHVRFALTTGTAGGTIICTDIWISGNGTDPF